MRECKVLCWEYVLAGTLSSIWGLYQRHCMPRFSLPALRQPGCWIDPSDLSDVLGETVRGEMLL